MTSAGWELRAHDSVHDRVADLSIAAIPDYLREAAMELLRKVMEDPDSCRHQAIRWQGSNVSGFRTSRISGPFELRVWWSMVVGQSFVWALTFNPPLDP